MCPVCIATMTVVVAGSASTGGLTALVAKKFRRKSDAKLVTNNLEQIESGTKQGQEKGK